MASRNVNLLEQQIVRETRYEKAMRSALARAPFLEGEGRYLSRDTLHDRSRLR